MRRSKTRGLAWFPDIVTGRITSALIFGCPRIAAEFFGSLNIVENNGCDSELRLLVLAGEITMPDAETAAVLRAVLDELCVSISQYDASTRTNVASSLLEAARQGKPSLDDLKRAGQQALLQPPTMWR